MRASEAVNIDDLREIARRRLPRFVFDYIDGGSDDEVSLRGNRRALEGLRFRPRTLVDVSERSAATRILGRAATLPVVVGPTGLNGLAWRDGDLALARAATSAGVPFCASTVCMSLLEDLVREAPGDHWLQCYVFRERSITEGILDRALDAGYETLVLTTDVPLAGKRERDLRSGLLPHQRFSLATKLDILRHPRWILSVATRKPRFVNVERELAPGQDANDFVARNMFDPTLSWDDLERSRKRWPHRLLVKGILRVEDAERAVALGADGVILSNHGGRQLDGCVSPLEMLSAVRDTLGTDATVLVDGGVRRGSDIAKAVALGADAVILGRAPVYGVAAGGRAGAARALEILADELDRTLALCGCSTVADLGPDLLRRGPSWPPS